MRVYVASNCFNETPGQLVTQLARIDVQQSKATPVIVVDERYMIAKALGEDAEVLCTEFHLDDLLDEKGSIANGVMVEGTNRIATKLSTHVSDWVVFEFGQNDPQTCTDFVRKIARYNYINPSLRNKNVVFSVPSMYLAFFARTLNESFNNLPIGQLAVAQSGQVGMLMMSTKIESVFVSLPLLSTPLIHLNRLAMFIHRRFVRSV